MRKKMANRCYNLLEIWGNEKVKKQIQEWNESLNSVNVPQDDLHRMGAIRIVFFPEITQNERIDFGSKWVHVDTISTGSDNDSLGFQSAWSRPKELEKKIACLLFDLDPNVVIRNSFNIEDGTEGVAYTIAKTKTEAFSAEATGDFNLDDVDEDEISTEEERRRDLYREEQIDLISDLIYEYPHIKLTFKEHKEELNLDDDFFED